MIVERDSVDGRFDRGIEQLDDQNEQYRRHQHRLFHTALAQPQAERDQHCSEQQLLPESIFVQERRREPVERIVEGIPDTPQPGLSLVWTLHPAPQTASRTSAIMRWMGLQRQSPTAVVMSFGSLPRVA